MGKIEANFGPGRYYIGDICYVLRDEILLPILHYYHFIPRLPSENGGLSGRTTETLK